LSLESFLFSAVAILAAVVFHEFAHAYAADRLGDPTPRRAGRLTLNPLPHIDPIGLIMLFVFRFGWARPVPFNPLYFRDRRRGTLVVAAAGPAANFATAVLVSLFLHSQAAGAGPPVAFELARWLLIYNVYLGVFNLVPIPPLDGSRILTSLLPGRQAHAFARLEQYGWLILILAIWTGVLRSVLLPVVALVFRLLGF